MNNALIELFFAERFSVAPSKNTVDALSIDVPFDDLAAIVILIALLEDIRDDGSVFFVGQEDDCEVVFSISYGLIPPGSP